MKKWHINVCKMRTSKRRGIKVNVSRGGGQGRGNEERTHRWDWGGAGRGCRRHWWHQHRGGDDEGLWGLSHRESGTWERMRRIGGASP